MSNNKYIPDVGSECYLTIWEDGKWKDYPHKVRIDFLGMSNVIVTTVDAPRIVELRFVGGLVKFRPVKSKAEKRRDDAVSELENIYVEQSTLYHGSARSLAEIAIDAGWIKPKPLTADVIKGLMGPSFKSHGIDFDKNAVNHINAYIRGELDL